MNCKPNRMTKLNEALNPSSITEGKVDEFTTTPSAYDKESIMKKNPNGLVDYVAALPIIKHTAVDDGKKAEYTSETIGWVASCGGGSSISILDLFNGNFGDNENKRQQFKTSKEALKAATDIAEAWFKFLKSYNVKR